MSEAGVILHRENGLRTPDWAELRSMVEETAAKRITEMLRGWDRTEKQLYALRGMAMLIIEERQLFRWVMDEEVGDYFQSFDRFLKQTCPESWSYCRQALNTIKELKETPFEELVHIRRCNLEQLKKVSTSVRKRKDVIAAAKTLPEKAFVELVNTKFDQHLEVKRPVEMAPTGDVDEFEAAVQMALEIEEDCKTRADALKAVGIHYLSDPGNVALFERKKEETV